MSRAAAYAELTRRASALGVGPPRTARMEGFVEDCWELLAPTGVSWVGFYLPAVDGSGLVLGPRRDRPACSPIGLHGACGRCFLSARPVVVADVTELGAAYVACDPRDRSELVLPCREPGGTCWGVLDLDSHALGAFDWSDAEALAAALHRAGLDAPLDPGPGPG